MPRYSQRRERLDVKMVNKELDLVLFPVSNHWVAGDAFIAIKE